MIQYNPFQQPGRMDCSELIKHNPAIPYAFSRAIDAEIHKELIYDPYTQFMQHQLSILEKTEGCEKAVFNDPRAEYFGPRPWLKGPTGTMSAIMTNGYLFLYNRLLEKVPDLQVNADMDLRLLLNLLQYVPQEPLGTLKLIDNELYTIRSLVEKLYARRREPIFSPAWYSAWEAAIRDLDERATRDYRYYMYGDPRRKTAIEAPVGFFRGREETRPYIQELEQLSFVPPEHFTLWEVKPPYVRGTNQFEYMTTDEILKTQIPMFKTIFPPQDIIRGGKHRKTRYRKQTKRRQTRRSR